MERRIDPDAPLDYVELQIFPSHNRYEACVSTSNIAEMAASGDLQQLLLHLPQVKDLSSKTSDSNFKILAPDDVKDTDWFTTTTLKRFLHIVGSPEILTIGNEICQLEETRKFQLSLFAKAEVNMTSSFESMNELLRAVDLRLGELKEKLTDALNEATGATCLHKDVSDMENLAHHFGAEEIRDSLQKFLELSQTKDSTPEITIPQFNNPPVKYGVSPAKAAQIERQISTDSESSFSSEDDQPPIERSRTPVRSSAASRRSASPMRRIQIGRGGPRRAAILNIKSLNHFKPITTTQKDVTAQSSEDEQESSGTPANHNNALRMSVQDKISLFENKQKDQTVDVDIPKPKINKAVLRRWSSGMGETRETSSPSNPENEEKNIESSSPKKADDVDDDVDVESCEKDKNKNKNKNPSSWSEEKEAELNQLFTKMMETKPVRRHSVTSDNSKTKSNNPKEQRGGFYENYKQKRDEKLRGKKAEKEGQLKKIDDSKPEIVSKPQKNSQRNPTRVPVVSKKEPVVKKATTTTKVVTKPSHVPLTRKSWPSAPSPKPNITTTPTRKPQSVTPPPAPPVRSITAKVEKSKPQLKNPKPTPPDAKMKPKTEKKQPPVVKTLQASKPKTPVKAATTTAVASAASAKPSFYNKVTKKSSVVPLETKPFLRKGARIGPGGGPVVVKSKVIAQAQPPIQSEENPVVETPEISQSQECGPPELEVVNPTEEKPEICNNVSNDDGDRKVETMDDDNNNNNNNNDKNDKNVMEDELTISPTAWVEIEEEEKEEEIIACKESAVQVSNAVAPGGVSSPRVRHSLFQMLLEETSEADSCEWGNAQHPPAQKDAPKGLKRLLKFARKSKGDLSLSDGSSPSSIFRRG